MTPTDGNEDAGDEMEVAVEPGEDRVSARRCLASGSSGPRDGMIRFVVGPDGDLVPDVGERLPGRGMWLSADRSAVDRATAKNLFSKAARRSVRVPADLTSRLVELLSRRCLDHIGMARRAGQALAGYEKVREALKTGRVGRGGPVPALLVEATDASPDQRGKLTALAPGMPVIDAFPAVDLAAALGREHAVHAVVAQGRLADALRRDAGRLAGLRGFETHDDGTRPTLERNDNA